jgi:UDP-N-acetylglucosamine 4,6-dehydratase/5-epimerase
MNILITGGTGSLGQHLVRRLMANSLYERICIYSRDEHKQAKMAETFTGLGSEKLRFFIGDVRDHERLQTAFDNIDYIVHAAALKIVPSSEYNPFETVKTNVIGTQNIIDAALWGGISKVIFISSDKAVNPTNLYGATKLCAEKQILAANNIHGPQEEPHFSIVRYGNVADSNGSVIPKFAEACKARLYPAITDYEMTRFWITLDQACDTIECALQNMRGGEVFIPIMERFRVANLADAMMTIYNIEQFKLTPSGIRAGEKMHESIIDKDEQRYLMVTKDEKYYVLAPEIYPEYKRRFKFNRTSNELPFLTAAELETKLRELGYGLEKTIP